MINLCFSTPGRRATDNRALVLSQVFVDNRCVDSASPRAVSFGGVVLDKDDMRQEGRRQSLGFL